MCGVRYDQFLFLHQFHRLEMIKRRFYRLEHGDNDNASDSSVSSSDSEPEVGAEESQDDVEVQEDDESCSTSSGLFIFIP